MIALVAAALLAQPASTKIVELSVPESRMIVAQAFVKSFPIRSDHDAAVWDTLGHSLLEGTKELTATQLRQYGGQAGYPPQVVVMPDYLVIQVVVPVGGLDLAGQLIETIVQRPRLRDDSIMDVIRRRQVSELEPFEDALLIHRRIYGEVKPDHVRLGHELAFRPENVSLVVAGDFAAGQATEEVSRRFGKWLVGRKPAQWRRYGGIALKSSRIAGVTSYELSADTLTPATPFSGARMVATVALGVGKDCTMFRVLREEMGLSYTQEGLLWPTASGWEPRFVLLQAKPANAEVLEHIRVAMIRDVESWNEATLTRAITLTKASLRQSVPFSPFWLSTRGPMGESLMDKAAWRGYLTMAGSGAVSAELLADAVGQVDLETLKAQAVRMIEGASGRMITGSFD